MLGTLQVPACHQAIGGFDMVSEMFRTHEEQTLTNKTLKQSCGLQMNSRVAS